MKIRNLCVAFTLALSLGLAARAQSVSSQVGGSATDSTGAAVPNAQVTLTNIQTGVSQMTKTDGAGNYAFPSVPLGYYNLAVTAPGFGTYRLNNFNVIVGQRATEDVKLAVASQQQEVNVNAGALADLLQPESNDLGTVIGPQTVAQIPLNGRNFLQLGLLSGATQLPTGAANSSIAQTGASSTNSNRLLSLLVAGNEPDYTMYLINGIQTIGTRAGNSSLNLSVSAVDQFVVHYGYFMPDLGPNPGIVDVASKAGTNHFHGEVYEFFRNTALKALDFNSHGIPVPYHQHQFGVAVGGPIRRDKLFFFFNYEGYRQTQSTVSTLTVPSTAMASGDFSALSTPIYNPFNVVAGQRVQFSGNKIDPTLINPAAKALLQYYAAAPTAGNFNYVVYPKGTIKTDQFTGRFDFTLNQRNTFFAQGTYLISPYNSPGAFANQGSQYPLDTELGVLGWTSTYGSNKVNDLRIGWTRNSVFNRGYTAPGVQQALNITGTADSNGIPGIGFAGGGTSYAGFGTAAGLLGDVDDSYQVNDAFNWTRGKHQIKMGFLVNYTRTVDSSANATARGSITFGGAQDFTSQIGGSSTGANASGNSFADYLLGLPAHGEAKGMPPTHYRYTAAQPYIQDTWKVTPSFTANLALAWYVTTPPNPHGVDKTFIHGFDFSTGLETFAALGQMNPEVYAQTNRNFAPRIGGSYQIDPHTVLRGGFGMYYTTQMMLNVQYSVVSNIITINNAVTNNPNTTPAYVLGKNIWGDTPVGQITPGQVAGITGPLQYYSQHQPSPYIYQYNMDIERTFGPYLVDVAYIGNAAHRLAVNYNPFDCSAVDFTCDNSRIPYQVNGSPKYPYAQEVDNIGYSNYNGLVAKFQRQFTNGLSILSAYTYSKSLAEAQEGGNSTLNEMKSCFQCDYGKATYNVPQALSVSIVWDIPFGRDRRFGASVPKVVDLVAGGWNLDAIGQFQKGNPINITEPNSTLWPADNTRPDWYCDGHKNLANKDIRSNGYRWLSPAKSTAASAGCYLVSTKSGRSGTATAPRYFGDTHFDSLDGPGIDNYDLAVHKDFGIYRDWKFGLRGEFFNAFNHVSFANPDSGVSSGTFGIISTSQHQARIIQVAAKITF